ncbi:unnamed protein product, partial [Prorocentrum cordatum]
GPIDVDPSYNQEPRVSLRRLGDLKWDIIVKNLHDADDLVIQSPSGTKVAFTQFDNAFFNTTLSVMKEVKLGSTLSVEDVTLLGNKLSVSEETTLGNMLSVSNEVLFGSVLSVYGSTVMGQEISVREQVLFGSSIEATGDAYFLGETFSVLDNAKFGTGGRCRAGGWGGSEGDDQKKGRAR